MPVKEPVYPRVHRLLPAIAHAVVEKLGITHLPDLEGAQVAAALQPDLAQIEIQILQGRVAAHLQVQPVVAAPGILHLQMVERLILAALGIGRDNGLLALRAGAQMARQPAAGNLFAAVDTGAGGCLRLLMVKSPAGCMTCGATAPVNPTVRAAALPAYTTGCGKAPQPSLPQTASETLFQAEVVVDGLRCSPST